MAHFSRPSRVSRHSRINTFPASLAENTNIPNKHKITAESPRTQRKEIVFYWLRQSFVFPIREI
ncbi:uncharacterized protein Dvar_38030 [Desulfosarcina variabilis str. Montpellier]